MFWDSKTCIYYIKAHKYIGYTVYIGLSYACVMLPCGFVFWRSVAFASAESLFPFSCLWSWVHHHCSDRAAFSSWDLCLSRLSTEWGNTNRALSGHIFFKSRRRQSRSSARWCAAFINKTCTRHRNATLPHTHTHKKQSRKSKIDFTFEAVFSNIFRDVCCCPSRHVCCHSRLHAQPCQPWWHFRPG